ncbi:MAG: alkaline phosphatase family protein, partial [Gammaproteobacteria bacterium]
MLMLILSVAMLISIISYPAMAESSRPRLIIQITVDQLRGDLPDKYMRNMGGGGFRYLKENGIWYKNANYNHSNTETVVGHTTLATGADPSVHGMVSNVWYDRDKGRLVYNIEDKNYHILSKNADIDD